MFSWNVYAETIQLSSSVEFAKGSSVRDAVKKECELTTKLPEFIQTYAKKYDVDLTLSSKKINKNKGQVLVVEITRVHASAGGAFSGPKSVSVSGKLLKNGKVTATFTGSRYSTGGFFAAYKGTCAIAGRCVKTLGSDIAKWLKKPVSGAHLGDGA